MRLGEAREPLRGRRTARSRRGCRRACRRGTGRRTAPRATGCGRRPRPAAKAASISTCHSHQDSAQLRAKTTAIIASASSTNADIIDSSIRDGRLPPEQHVARGADRVQHDGGHGQRDQDAVGPLGQLSARAAAGSAPTTRPPRPPSEPAAHAQARPSRMTRPPGSPARSTLDAAASSDPIASPTGVATTKPAFGVSQQDAGRRQGVQAEEPGRGEERQRHQEHPRVAAAHGRRARGVRQERHSAPRWTAPARSARGGAPSARPVPGRGQQQPEPHQRQRQATRTRPASAGE